MKLTTADNNLLEAEIAAVTDPHACIVLCHPHPLFGGTMKSHVISEVFRAASSLSVNMLRFNFRGVEASTGEFSGGDFERFDIEAAVRSATELFPELPILLFGWSFGGGVASSVSDPAIAGWILVSPGMTWALETEQIACDSRPKWVIRGLRDTTILPESLDDLAAWTNCQMIDIPGADHYFIGRIIPILDALREAINTVTQ